MVPYLEIADEFGYRLWVKEPPTSWRRDPDICSQKSRHGVSRVKTAQMVRKFRPCDERQLRNMYETRRHRPEKNCLRQDDLPRAPRSAAGTDEIGLPWHRQLVEHHLPRGGFRLQVSSSFLAAPVEEIRESERSYRDSVAKATVRENGLVGILEERRLVGAMFSSTTESTSEDSRRLVVSESECVSNFSASGVELERRVDEVVCLLSSLGGADDTKRNFGSSSASDWTAAGDDWE
ncbi:unnamed protein product [Notodromas monacha]|nr:unnamed protein product [Notodromas monacha]CAG0917080.1 unnamed protein product [Notodromas monacha]